MTRSTMPDTVCLAPIGWRTGIQPVRADSASRLSANETTGWKPVGQDRRDACPPAKLTVLAITPVDNTLTPRDPDHRLRLACRVTHWNRPLS